VSWIEEQRLRLESGRCKEKVGEVGAIRELDGDGGGKDARKSQQVLEAGEEEVGGICSAIHECE
jgi:hypothetical protein